MFEDCDVRTTWLQKIPFATKLYKNMLTLMPSAWEQLDLTEYDLVLSSCSSCCKGLSHGQMLCIFAIVTHQLVMWDFYYQYLKKCECIKKLLMPRMIHKMKIWDQLAANRVDYFISNSNFIAQRIKSIIVAMRKRSILLFISTSIRLWMSRMIITCSCHVLYIINALILPLGPATNFSVNW